MPTGPISRAGRSLRQGWVLWQLFRREQTDPAPFYRRMASNLLVDLDQRYGPLTGRRLLDLGCGPGWYAEALEAAGAIVVAVDRDVSEIASFGASPRSPVLADAGQLPFAAATFDGIVCSNLLEHAPDTGAILGDIARVLRPDAWAYVSWTNWYSPWGGHEMSPWHLLGPSLGPRVYERRHGPPRKNRIDEGLFPVHIGSTLRLVRASPALVLEGAEPRYWPWARVLIRVPGLRELVTWNCVLRLRRSVMRAAPAEERS